jgi:DNA-binding response OmpR family regulator
MRRQKQIGSAATVEGRVNILEGAKVFLLEDDFLINEATADLLREFGCDVTSMFGIQQALAALEDERPHAAVLDINIKGEPSYPVADRLHELSVPIVFLTGYEMPALDGPWSQHPVCRKPCDPDLLKRLLTEALRTHQDQASP